jgi:hypothetical protein
MQSGLRSAILGVIVRLRRGHHQERPHGAESEGDHRKHKDDTANHREAPTADMLRAEWATFQTLIREIHRSEEQHQRAERDLGAAQLRAAKGLNWVTAIGATLSFLALLGVIASVIIAKRAADDGRIAAEAARSQAFTLADTEQRQLRAYLSPHWAPIRRTSRSYRVSSVQRSPGTPQL